MKKLYFFTLLTLCLCSVSFGQEMLLNGGLENWIDDTTPSDWSKAENTTKESTEKRTGNFSAKMIGGTKDLAQTITGIIAGDSYTITIWYKVESGDGTDARIWSYWKDGSNANIDNDDIDSEDAIRGPNNEYLDNNGNVWTKYETTITAPSGATQFYFELRVYGSAVVYWDDLSFMHNVEGSAPVLLISSPANNSEIESTTSVDVSVSVSNFVVGAVGGTGVNGHIHWTLQKNSDAAVAQPMKYNTDDETITVEPGNTYTVFMEFVDDSHTPINPAVSATSTFTIKNPCDLNLETINTTCVTSTSVTDTYDISIAFTGGNTSTYILATDNGTIGGDNPSTNVSGTITITGVTEDVNVIFTVQGDNANSSCNLTRNISSPTCAAFPLVDEFNYTVGANLADQTPWTKANTGDEILIAAGNLDYTGLKASTGNKITFDGGGSESYISFADVTSGTVFASFLLKVTNISAMTDVADGGYIASLAGSTSGYDARFWVRPNPDTSGTTFDIGFGQESSNPPFTSGTYNVNDVLFVVMAYNQDNNSISTWINPDVSSFEGTIPAATLSSIDTAAPSSINLFILRQDSTGETPFVEIDALRISDNWADVTPKDATASVKNNQIEGFATYPNPVTSDNVTITSNSADKKEVAIFNVLGKKVVSRSFLGTKSEINVANLSSGIYILKVKEGTKSATSKLIIK